MHRTVCVNWQIAFVAVVRRSACGHVSNCCTVCMRLTAYVWREHLCCISGWTYINIGILIELSFVSQTIWVITSLEKLKHNLHIKFKNFTMLLVSFNNVIKFVCCNVRPHSCCGFKGTDSEGRGCIDSYELNVFSWSFPKQFCYCSFSSKWKKINCLPT